MQREYTLKWRSWVVLLQGNKATVEEGTAEQNRAEILSTAYCTLRPRTGYRVYLCIVAIPPREMNALGCGRLGRLPRCVLVAGGGEEEVYTPLGLG